MDFQCTLFDITSRLIVWAVYYPLSSGIASGVGTAGMVTWHLHLTRPCGLFNIAVFLVAQKVGSPKTQKFPFSVTLGCGSKIAENCTYFQSASTSQAGGQCGVTICKCSSDICQVCIQKTKRKKNEFNRQDYSNLL